MAKTNAENIRNAVLIFGQTGTGDNKSVLVGADGQILQAAYFDTVIIEAPGVNDEYLTVSGTINNGASNQEVTLTGLTTAYAIQAINKTDDKTITMKLNDTGNNAINITNDTTLGRIGVAISNQKFTSLYLSNASGVNVDYELIIRGV